MPRRQPPPHHITTTNTYSVVGNHCNTTSNHDLDFDKLFYETNDYPSWEEHPYYFDNNNTSGLGGGFTSVSVSGENDEYQLVGNVNASSDQTASALPRGRKVSLTIEIPPRKLLRDQGNTSENAALDGGSSSSFVDDNVSASSSDNDQTVDQTEKKRKFNDPQVSRKKK